MRILLLGALGEVGDSLNRAFAGRGHEVQAVSSRAAALERDDVISVETAAGVIDRGETDLIVNASGRGDRRESTRAGVESARALADRLAGTEIPAVLISTTRVLEGWATDYAEDADPRATSPYAEANAEHERLWLAAGPATASVLRITNYFCRPQAADSPQSLLLPWSLVTEAVTDGRITVRAGRSMAKEFVNADDVVRAIEVMASSESRPAVCATAPGTMITIGELAHAVSRALVSIGHREPDVTFGVDSPAGPVCLPGWLAEHGWQGGLGLGDVEAEIRAWLVGSGNTDSATP